MTAFPIAFFGAPNALTAAAPPPTPPPGAPTPAALAVSYANGGNTATVGTIAGPFTVSAASGSFMGTLSITCTDSSAVISPSTLTNGGSFTVTPHAIGNFSINFSNNGGMTNPSSIAFTSTAVTTLGLTGPSSGTVGIQTGNFNITTPSGFTGTTNVISGNGGTFTQNTFTGEGPFTFKFTPSNPGTYNISLTNTGNVANPSPISFTSTIQPAVLAISGPNTGAYTVSSGNFVLAVQSGTFVGVVTAHSNVAGDEFTPATRVSAGAFTLKPAGPGVRSITFTDTGGMSYTPTSLTYTAT